MSHDAKKPEQDDIVSSTNKFLKREISRRDFLVRMSALGLSLPALGTLLAAGGRMPDRGAIPAYQATAEATLAQNSSALKAETLMKQKYSGKTLNVVWESGLQSQDPINFSGPLLEKRTGVKLNVIQGSQGTDLLSKQLTEHTAATGAFDVLSVQPAWMPDMVYSGAVEPLDDYIKEYMNPADLADYTDLYRDLGKFEGKNYGLFDDGDTLLLYYRKDLFDQYGKEFSDQVGHPLTPPKNWKEFDEIARFFTKKLAPDVYGASFLHGTSWNAFMFIPHFKANGGKFFDPDTMAPLINSKEALRTVMEMKASNQWMEPGSDQWDAGKCIGQWLAGKMAMTWFWAPLGRFSANWAQQSTQLADLPKSTVAGKVGYALLPGDITEMAGGFNVSVSADSPQKELAYLFCQWVTSPEISLMRVMLPYTLRDPYRITHYQSAQYKNLWPDAPQYLDTLLDAGKKASMDIVMPGGQQYQDAIDRACTATYSGTEGQKALDTAAKEFDEITNRLGKDKQKQAYANYLKLKGAYPSANLVNAPSNLDLK